jgi:hypothetical protein
MTRPNTNGHGDDPIEAIHARLRATADAVNAHDQAGAGGPLATIEGSRVDLAGLVLNGRPERDWLPASHACSSAANGT